MKKAFLSLALASLLLASSVPAMAFEADIPEAAGEKATVTEDAALAETVIGAPAPAAYSEQDGLLVWFDNFSGTPYAGNIADVDIMNFAYSSKTTFDGYYVLKCGMTTVLWTYGLEVQPNNGDTFVYTDGHPISGSATMYTDLYIDSDTAAKRLTVAGPGTTWGGYWTSWNSSKQIPDIRTWETVRSTATSLSGYNRFGLVTATTHDSSPDYNEYYRAVGLYVKPDNAVILADGTGNYSLLFPDNTGKIQIPTAAPAYLCNDTLYNPGSTVDASGLLGKVLNACELYEKPADFDETLGALVYYDNFLETPFSLLDSGVTSSVGSVKTVIDGKLAVEGGKSNLISGTYGIGLKSEDAFTYAENGVTVSGKLTIVGDLIQVGANEQCAYAIRTSADAYAGWGGWGAYIVTGGTAKNRPTADTWENFKVTTDAKTSFKALGIVAKSLTAPTYAHGVAAYIMPDNAFFISDLEGNHTLIVPEGDTYTVPDTYPGWMAGSTMCRAGDVLNVSDLIGKTLTPYMIAEAPEAENAAMGKLVYFNNFSGSSDFENLIDLTVKCASAPSVLQNKFGVYGTTAFYSDAFGGALAGIELVQSDTYDDWTFKSGKKAAGEFYIVAEIAMSDTTRQVYNIFYNGTEEYGAGWNGPGDYKRTNWSGPSVGTDFTVWTPANHPEAVSSIKRWGIGINASALAQASRNDKIFFHAIAVYYKEKLADEGAPLSFDKVSVRTTGSTGFRVAAYVDDEQRAAADKYGFIIALDEALDGDAASKLVFNAANDASGVNAAGVKYVSGVNYDSSNGTDLIYATDGAFLGQDDLEGTFFTAVLTGITESAYDTDFAIRPYIVQDGVTLYGKTVVRSMYTAAKTVADAGYNGLDDDAKQFIDDVISAVED